MNRILVTVLLAIVAVGGGVIVATRVNLDPHAGPATDSSVGIQAITFGIRQADGSTIKTRDYYYPNEPLALRVERRQLNQPVSLNARLLGEDQSVIPLKPSRVTIPANETLFCCFTEPPEGKYTLQLFRPDGVTTNIPITIRPARSAPGGSFGGV